MFDDLGSLDGPQRAERDVLAELEQNSEAQIQSHGGPFRVKVKCKLSVMPGNASQRFERKVEGISHELTDQGITGLFGYQEMPTNTLADEILTPGTGQIKALICVGG